MQISITHKTNKRAGLLCLWCTISFELLNELRSGIQVFKIFFNYVHKKEVYIAVELRINSLYKW
jgi:hypothetical protein